MPHPRSQRLVAAALITSLLVAAAPAAHAQSAQRTARPDPLDAKSAVPAVTYESSLAKYRRMLDGTPVPWREANDNVTRIGGWRAYAREAQQPDAVPAAQGVQPSMPARPASAVQPALPSPAATGGTPPPNAQPDGHDGHHAPSKAAP